MILPFAMLAAMELAADSPKNGRLDVTASIPALTPEEEQPPLDGCEGDWKVKWDTGQGKLSVRGRKAMLEGESL